ncbi:Ligand-binding SRPBCC domain protein family [Cupriavidus sp. U2]|uniref:SRPBCC family protein n=1 Tax=Cupriavidus sp. U2 TaxID=2920269 RepID=UPI00129E0224|nr:SRPBCC family protein [Cupriavidus sp. U2]KAI3592118.1 Ligand-binding SRPBCC domain protein family [Cupriavidus sp. U2]
MAPATATATKTDTPQHAQHRLTVSRAFNAPRDLVFKAWSTADHLKHWFCPQGFTVPACEVEFHPGGKFDLCMRSQGGEFEHWIRGHFVEVMPHARLVIDMTVVTVDGKPLFNALTTVGFETVCGGTEMSVTQDYTLLDPSAGDFTRGAEAGWKQTLDRLEQEVARIVAEAPARSVAHGTFSISRTFDAPPALLFRALSDPAAKAQWFRGGPGYQTVSRAMDVRPGGREHLQGKWENGLVSTFDAVYFDVIPNERLVYSYEMHMGDRKISVSLAVFELKAVGQGTQLTLTEHGAFLDGYDDAGSREHGSRLLLDAIGEWVGQAR